MKKVLPLCVFMLLAHVSLAAWQCKTVLKGRTLDLHCPVKRQSPNYSVEWKNPDGNIMFFNTMEGMKDGRYSLVKLSNSEYVVRISNVTFSDGGKYTCTQYLQNTGEDRTVKVTVLARPKVESVTHDGMTVIKCTAEGNYPAPVISWKINNGPKIHPLAETTKEGKKFVVTDMLHLSINKPIKVMCLVHHPALPLTPLMDFIQLTPPRTRKRGSTTNFPVTATSKTKRETTTGRISTTETEAPKLSTFRSHDAKTSTDVPLTSSEVYSSSGATVIPDSATQNQTSPEWNITRSTTTDSSTQTSQVWNFTGFTTVAAITNISNGETTKNSTEHEYDVERRQEKKGDAILLVFLVTCLILSLLVVVIFIGVKLRRAHIAWKRENDESDTSETSGKSKTSQEDKNAQKRRGFFNTRITQYVVQEPTVITSVANPGALAPPEDPAQIEVSTVQQPPQTTAKPTVKETEL